MSGGQDTGQGHTFGDTPQGMGQVSGSRVGSSPARLCCWGRYSSHLRHMASGSHGSHMCVGGDTRVRTQDATQDQSQEEEQPRDAHLTTLTKCWDGAEPDYRAWTCLQMSGHVCCSCERFSPRSGKGGPARGHTAPSGRLRNYVVLGSGVQDGSCGPHCGGVCWAEGTPPQPQLTSKRCEFTFLPFLFQVTRGLGSPVAWHTKEATPPDTPIWSLGSLINLGGSGGSARRGGLKEGRRQRSESLPTLTHAHPLETGVPTLSP